MHFVKPKGKYKMGNERIIFIYWQRHKTCITKTENVFDVSEKCSSVKSRKKNAFKQTEKSWEDTMLTEENVLSWW